MSDEGDSGRNGDNLETALMDRLIDFPGSTRSVAIMRTGLVCVGWAEFGNVMQPHRADTPGWLSALYFVSTFAMFIGFRARLATAAAGLAFFIILMRIPGAMHHHTYLLMFATLILALTPCGSSLSLDRWLALRRGDNPPERGNLWALRLIGLQVSAVFFWGGYNKLTLGTKSLQTAFLTGDRLEQVLVYYYPFPVHAPWWMSAAFTVMGAGVVVFELATAFGLWIPRTRYWCILGCMLLTGSFQVLLSVGTFGALSYLLYLAFVPPDDVHRVIDRLLGASTETASTETASTETASAKDADPAR